MYYLITSSILIICTILTSTFGAFGQTRISVIDSSATTGYLFNSKNQQSLISLIKNNEMALRAMDFSTSEHLLETGVLKSEISRSGPQSYVPLSNSLGEDSIATFSGIQMFVYPPADEFYLDLDGITRILVVEKANPENPSEYKIYEIILAKKYPGMKKYVLVGSVAFDQLSNGNKFIVFEELESSKLTTLLTEPNHLWQRWSMDCKTKLEDIEFYIKVPGLSWNSDCHPDFNFGVYSELLPERIKQENVWYHKSFWPYSASPASDALSDLKRVFGDVNIEGQEGTPSHPLASVTGEDSIVVVNGEVQAVYPEPDFYAYWMDVTPSKAWLVYALDHNKGEPKKELRRIVFITSFEGNDIPLADYDVDYVDETAEVQTRYNQAIEKTGIPLEASLATDWMKNLESEMKKSQVFMTNSKSDLKKLNKTYFELKLLGLGGEYKGFVREEW